MPADNANEFYTILHCKEVDERNKYGSVLFQSTFHTQKNLHTQKNQQAYSNPATLLRISHFLKSQINRKGTICKYGATTELYSSAVQYLHTQVVTSTTQH